MPYDTGMADRLRKAGLGVKEVSGWKSKGNSSGGNFHPKGFVVHHTAGAGPSAGPTPSLNTVINGRPDLPGPLANLYMDYNGIVHVIAAGVANHAGTPDGGVCRGMHGNSDCWGIEIEHPGTTVLDVTRVELAAKATAAIIAGTCDETMVVYHKEWAPSRKIDLATGPSADTFRAKVKSYLSGSDEMGYPEWFWDWANWYLTTDRSPDARPDAAPDDIPQWAWDGIEDIDRISKRYGMTEGERDWITWYNGGKQGPRPNVPQTIPPRWWPDQTYVNELD